MTAVEVLVVDEVRALGRARDLLLAKLEGDHAYRVAVSEVIMEIERAIVEDDAAVATMCLIDSLARYGHVLAIAATRPSDRVTSERAVRLAYRTLCTTTVGAADAD